MESVWSLTNAADESVLNTYQYHAFGATHGTVSENITNPYRFTGRRWESQSGTHHYRGRQYVASIGRFLSADPIGLNGGDSHLYRYVLNSPANLADPDGKIPVPVVTGLIGAALGRVFGVISAGINGGNVLQGVLQGAVYGGIAGATMGLLAPAVASAAGGGVIGGIVSGRVSSAVADAINQGVGIAVGWQDRYYAGQTGLAFLAGAAFGSVALRPSTAQTQTVTHWNTPSNIATGQLRQGSWVMTGRNTVRNYIFSGTNYGRRNSLTVPGVPRSSLSYPSGWQRAKGPVKGYTSSQRVAWQGVSME